MWAEEPPVDLVLKPPALLKHNRYGIERVGIEGKVPRFTAGHGRLSVADRALEHKLVSEAGHGMEPFCEAVTTSTSGG